MFYKHLAQHLGGDQPVYGLQTAIDEKGEPKFAEVEAMASQYIQEIRSVQPEGPYYLGGLCMAGIIAFEMAQQLQAQGQRVAVLALLDTPIPSSTLLTFSVRRLRSTIFWTRRLLYVMRQGLWLNPRQYPGHFWKLVGEIKKMVVPNPIPQTNQRAGRRYIARDYTGAVDLFLPERNSFGTSR